MPKGVPTSPDTVAQFRAHYLYSGNAAESARSVDLPESTGRDLARELSADPEFVATRRKLRDQYLDDLVASRMRVVSKSLERFEGELPIPEVGDGGVVTVIDKRPEYGKLVLDAEKNAHNLAKLDSGASDGQAGATEVHIHLASDDDDGDAKT